MEHVRAVPDDGVVFWWPKRPGVGPQLDRDGLGADRGWRMEFQLGS